MRATVLVLVLAGCADPHHATGGDAALGAYQLTCSSHGTTFPLLDKTCVQASDCFVALHQTDCCGTRTAIGLAVTSQSTFMTYEAKCDAAFPGCGCAEGPTAAEDGRSTLSGTIQVDCRMGQCLTYVP